MDTVHLVLLIALLAYLFLYQFIWKSDKWVQNQRIKHCLFLCYVIMFYFVAVYLFESGSLPIDTMTVSMVLSFIILVIAINIIIITFFPKHVVDITTRKQRMITLFLDLSIILFCFSFIHYFVFWNNPSSLQFETLTDGWFDTAISFLFYSFSTSITYSVSGVEPISSLAKILSMAQIGFFYLVLGESIFGELQKREE
ncbi:hypothetical protein [Peribacillus simplex]|uniref:hypothetical protein n=1 Tax=Peribacillus simplex TaxID=1478 RepID=UPI0028533837|nr:hypothetical protein [Peribacillus simplex]MDR4926511.1 hypothetical protein [Peribacillus simplex]